MWIANMVSFCICQIQRRFPYRLQRRPLTSLLCLAFLWVCAASGPAKVMKRTPPINQGGLHVRIKPLEEKDWTPVERELLASIKAERGSVPNIYKTMARHPKMFTPRLTFGRYIQRESTLPARDREILICRIAWLSSVEYEWSAHTKIALENGLTKEDIERIAKGSGPGGWSPFDAALMRAAEELYTDIFISDETWNALAKRYNTHQLMDVVMTVGGYHMLAMALRSFGVQLEPGATGFPAGSSGKRGVKPKGTGGVPIRLRTPRIQPVSEASWSQEERELLLPVRQQRGYILNVYATLACHPAMYRPWLGFARYILRESSLPAREREMLICRIAWLTGGEYEWSAHIRLGKEAGLTDAEIARLAKGPDASGWPPSDAVLVQAVDELYYDAFISDATWNTLAKRFDAHQMMDLVFTVGAYKMLAMALNSFGTQLDKDMSGFSKRG